VQHGVGGVFAFADFEHALEHRLALGHVGLDLERIGQLVHLRVGPFADLLLLARTDVGRIVPREPCDLAEIVVEAVPAGSVLRIATPAPPTPNWRAA